MAKSIYLINPREDFPGYFSLEVCSQGGGDKATLFADLSTTTLAAMVPPDWNIGLCDERIMSVDLDSAADVIGITGKISQRNRMIALAEHFRTKGRLVAIGGSYASLNPEDMRPHCDILVRGEAEEIANELFADIEQGQWRPEYLGNKVDLSRSPVPRWDLYPPGRALNGTVQTSRGCPFECEFCDVIQYVGRKQRHKPVDKVLAELDLLYDLGCRGVFLADDNFTVFRKRTKELLIALRKWNLARRDGPVSFSTQVSIDAARDDELLTLSAQAGLRQVFIGIETPNEDSLRETGKRQNLHTDLEREVRKFLAHGISVTCGIVIGFDSDGPGIFETQREFIERLPIPILSIGALVAPSQTPLHARLRREGRLDDSGAQSALVPWDTNIIPKQMSRDQLVEGIRGLCETVYAPAAFERRVMSFISAFRSLAADPRPLAHAVRAGVFTKTAVTKLREMGPEEERLCARIVHVLQVQPRDVQLIVLSDMMRYAQVRYMYQSSGFLGPNPRALRGAA